MIRSRFGTAAVAVSVVVLMTSVSAVASAGLTYRVVAGRTSSGTVGFTGKTAAGSVMAPRVTFTDTRTSTPIGCASGSMHGSVSLGRTRTAQLGTVASSSAGHCSAFGGLATLAYKHKGTWHFNGVSKTTNGVTEVSITALALVLSSSSCTLTVSGTADGTYSNSSKKLNLQPRSGSGHLLKASHVNGCGGVVNNGDKITFVAAFTLSTRKGALHIS